MAKFSLLRNLDLFHSHLRAVLENDRFLRHCPSLIKEHVRPSLGVGLLTARRVRPITSPSKRSEIAENGHRAKLPENPANIALLGQNSL
jgi:hypothetical protein